MNKEEYEQQQQVTESYSEEFSIVVNDMASNKIDEKEWEWRSSLWKYPIHISFYNKNK